MARPSQDPQIRINEILETAEPLFYSKGYHETAISDIVNKMGVAHGTIYYYFKSKEEILEALINRHFSALMSEVMRSVHSNQMNPSDKFNIVIQTLFKGIHRQDGLLFEFLYNERAIHFIDKLARQGKQLINPLLLQIMEEGQEQQCFHIRHLQAAANMVDGMIDSLIEVIYEKSSEELLACQFKLAEDLMEYALGAKKGTVHILCKNAKFTVT